MTYEVEVETRAKREYRDLPSQARKRLSEAIDHLQKDPRPPGAKHLMGENGYRIRRGDYRILYTVDDICALSGYIESAIAARSIDASDLFRETFDNRSINFSQQVNNILGGTAD